MAKQEKRPGESIDALLRKFKRKVKNEGLLQEVRSREFHESSTEEKLRLHKAAQRRTKMQQRQDEL